MGISDEEGEVLTSGQSSVSGIVLGANSAGLYASFVPYPGTAFRWVLLATAKRQGNIGSERLRDWPRVTCSHRGTARPRPRVWHLYRLLHGGEGESGGGGRLAPATTIKQLLTVTVRGGGVGGLLSESVLFFPPPVGEPSRCEVPALPPPWRGRQLAFSEDDPPLYRDI